jgi:four helix bundle protein
MRADLSVGENDQGHRIRKAPARTFRDLDVWKDAHAFALGVYKVTREFPAEERFGLSSQFRRSAVSIPANIAEGFRKFSPADKARFLNISEGSVEECRYYCLLAEDLGYAKTSPLQKQLDAIAKQLATYIRLLRRA